MDSTHMVQGLLHDMVCVDVSYIMPKLWILNELGYSYIPYTEYNIVKSKNSPFLFQCWIINWYYKVRAELSNILIVHTFVMTI